MSAPAPQLADADAARREAAAILRESRFHNPKVPRPLHGVLHDLGDVIGAVGRAVTHGVDSIGSGFPGGTVVVWIVLGLVLLGTIAYGARRYSRRALLREPGRGIAGRRGGGPERAGDLEREAARAERDGRFEEAVRLRFRAGLARLAEDGAIRTARSTPNAELSRTLQSPDFDALARRFDEIAYGASAAGPDDADEARRRWGEVVTGRSRS
ncbi:MAG TPA: hypothetical protein VMB27_07330 [Solirubrobacteraceae bacterium]|nr:hypothetical protein [Solirubrobacteraceae bacterium]